MVNDFQREGSTSNAHVGRAFELEAQKHFWDEEEIVLQRPYPVLVGLSGKRKEYRRFDLGSDEPRILVECKSHTWTKSGHVPSAKITAWNEAMFFFSLTPDEGYRKVLFVWRSVTPKREESLAEYYVKNHQHLIPDDVEIWEFDGSEHRVVWPSNT